MGSAELEICQEESRSLFLNGQEGSTAPLRAFRQKKLSCRNRSRAHMNIRLQEFLPVISNAQAMTQYKISLVQALFVSICYQECQIINTFLLPDTYRAQRDTISDIIFRVLLTTYIPGSSFLSPCVALLLIFSDAYLAP